VIEKQGNKFKKRVIKMTLFHYLHKDIAFKIIFIKNSKVLSFWDLWNLFNDVTNY